MFSKHWWRQRQSCQCRRLKLFVAVIMARENTGSYQVESPRLKSEYYWHNFDEGCFVYIAHKIRMVYWKTIPLNSTVEKIIQCRIFYIKQSINDGNTSRSSSVNLVIMVILLVLFLFLFLYLLLETWIFMLQY